MTACQKWISGSVKYCGLPSSGVYWIKTDRLYQLPSWCGLLIEQTQIVWLSGGRAMTNTTLSPLEKEFVTLYCFYATSKPDARGHEHCCAREPELQGLRLEEMINLSTDTGWHGVPTRPGIACTWAACWRDALPAVHLMMAGGQNAGHRCRTGACPGRSPTGFSFCFSSHTITF